MQSHILCQLFPCLDWEGLLTVSFALFTSCLDYCKVFYIRLPLKTTWKLWLIQNVAQIVKSAVQYTHVALWPQYIANCTDCYSPAGHIL